MVWISSCPEDGVFGSQGNGKGAGLFFLVGFVCWSLLPLHDKIAPALNDAHKEPPWARGASQENGQRCLTGHDVTFWRALKNLFNKIYIYITGNTFHS